MTVVDFETARRNMVEYQIRCCKVLDPVLLGTLETMPREDFLPESVSSLAYMEGRVPLPCGQEMLSPLQEAHILQGLELRGDERVLEIGTGTGFLTALLAMHAAEVVSYELHDELSEMAKKNLQTHGINNAKVIQANAMEAEALDNAGQFDAIVLGAALEEIPDHLMGHLRDGGYMMAFIGTNPVVSLVRMERTGNNWQQSGVFETVLQNMEGLPEKREFVF
ncbi:MAG TPA: protein-L-isoaspartate O-methyltransferase [Mariprofundaceae bacterium]|nr:protein-L-isoaspartate O-methyltransferase [Mariprofundaceae bacterium]